MLNRRCLKATILAVSLCGVIVQAAHAGPVSGLARGLQVSPPSQYIRTSKSVLAPFAYVKFCSDNQDDCKTTAGEVATVIDASRRRELVRINAAVNRSIRPRHDNDGSDEWNADVAVGDCEDFALTKRRALIRAGWAAGSLRLAVARTAAGEGHAVLVVKTSLGDLVLDNRSNVVRPWNQTDLIWEKIQSGSNPRLWLAI